MGIKKPGRMALPGFALGLAKKLVASNLDRAVDGINIQPGAATTNFSVQVTANKTLVSVQSEITTIDTAIQGVCGDLYIRAFGQGNRDTSVDRLHTWQKQH